MKGFKNLGNTCYLNSAVQLLMNVPEFCNMVLQNYTISNELTLLKKFIIKYHTPDIKTISPRFIKEIAGNRKNIFSGTSQEDSWEFLLFFLDFLDNQLKKHIINNLFGIKMKTIIKCKISKCLNTSITNNISLFLILPLNKNFKNLDDCYRNYKDRIKLNGDNKYYCEKCKKKIIASKRTETSKWPKNLLIVLRRFEQTYTSLRKNNHPINVPINWRHKYKLYGGVYHSGGLSSGHYTYFGNYNNSWYIFSDTSISKINKNNFDNIKNRAYILHYRIEE